MLKDRQYISPVRRQDLGRSEMNLSRSKTWGYPNQDWQRRQWQAKERTLHLPSGSAQYRRLDRTRSLTTLVHCCMSSLKTRLKFSLLRQLLVQLSCNKPLRLWYNIAATAAEILRLCTKNPLATRRSIKSRAVLHRPTLHLTGVGQAYTLDVPLVVAEVFC